MAKKAEKNINEKITALYCRLSVDDIKDKDKDKDNNKDSESNSITNQKQILSDYAKKHGYKNTMFFVDDGISGTTFDRPDFQRMERMIETGEIGTVIVKDLSRFGREHILFDHYTQVLYPSLGVNFISIQENVETISGKGTEMMPFHNLFNEWYASQTSKKIRQVWQSKSDNGERVSPTVPYGYKKDTENPKQWLIDEPAAKVVRYIYQLAMEGLGTTKIARRLEREEILTPTAYYASIGRKTRNPFTTSYAWAETSIEHILDNMQYTGCTVNFKTTTVSYKVHKKMYNDTEDWVIIPNTQESIIDMDTWERVQEIKKHRRRNTATGRESIFSGLVYCGDCGSRLYFCAAKSIKEHQEFFRCSAYKENRGSCSIHYIRNVVLEKMVLKTIREAAEYITEYEPVFLYLFTKEHRLSIANNLKEAKYELEKTKKRIQELDKLIEAVFEQNILGKLPDDRYNRMLTNYEKEQKDLIQKVEDAEKLINTAQQENIDVRNFLANIRQCTDIKELTPSIVNKLIDKIEVFDRVRGEDGKKHVPIKIHFVGVGIIQFPDSEMLEKAKEEMKAYSKKAS